MHGRIFTVDFFKPNKILYTSPWEEYELVKMIPGCDYVIRINEKDEEWKRSIDWFSSYFGRPSWVKGSFHGWQVSQLKEELLAEKKERVKKIKEIIERDGSLWEIHHIAWHDSTFWFIWPEYEFGPKMEFLEEFLLDAPEDEILLITEIYDYHI